MAVDAYRSRAGKAVSRIILAAAVVLVWPAASPGASREASGNTDGVLTWRLGDLEPGETARGLVLLVYDTSYDEAAKRLEAARAWSTRPAPVAQPSGDKPAAPPVWIHNGATDFALEGTALFRWRMERQALACAAGGQLSQFTWYVHYEDGDERRRAGTPHIDDSVPENLRVLQPVEPVSPTEIAAELETADKMLRIRVRALMGAGGTVGVEFLLVNTHGRPLGNVCLSAYANIEAAHTHEADYSCLDRQTAGLVVADPATGMCVVMAGPDPPAGGHAGTWCSLEVLRAADGIPFERWEPFDPKKLAEEARRPRRPARSYGQMIIPYVTENPETPPTRTLTPAEADEALRHDWLFQAAGERLRKRTLQEIGWARELAGRLAGNPATGDLQAELVELEALEKRLAGPAAAAVPAPGVPPDGSEAAWIWFPEGDPTRHAPVEARFFRRTLELPPDRPVQRAVFRVTADDACEVFVNGVRAGASSDWKKVADFRIEKLLKAGANVLAVRAENNPAPVEENPAGLICGVAVELAGGSRLSVASDASWRASSTEQPGWQGPGFDDSAWKSAMVAAPYGQGPWGDASDWTPGFGVEEDADTQDLYFAVRRVKRRIAFRNPVVDFSRLLFIDQPTPQGPVNPEHESIHRMGISATPGGRLLVLDGLHPGGAVRQLAPERPGSFWRPDLAFDARRVLFCYKGHDEPSFHLYEMDLDGTGLERLTDGPYDDIDPIYLPDGHIVFTTTRGNSYVRCGPFIYSYVLARCDADGSNLYLISYNGEPDFVPSLMDDGRVIYSRWEYTDKALWRVQSLWTVNPDGTQVSTFWGNQSVWPDHVAQPRQIPGSPRVMFCGVGHHDWWSGSIGILDPTRGRNFPHGLTKVTCDRPWPEVGNGPVDPGESDRYHASGKYTGYNTPYPLSEKDFLVSARGEAGQFRLYLMDTDGNRELIYEGAHNVLHAIPVKPRRRPPVRVDRVAWPGTGDQRRPAEPGIFYTADVCQGVPDLPPGKVKYLRIFQQDHKTYSTWEKTYRHSGPSVSIIQEEAVKRILGVVPVEEDGSVHFEVPPGRSLYFQLLDEQYRCLQTMRSFTGVMPGEVRGCVGCHEMHSTSPPRHEGTALRRPPSELTPPPWGTESIGYERFVQPVLDRYCVECHRADGPNRHEPDLTLRPGHGPFKEPYLTLVGSAGWGNPVKQCPGYGIAAAIPVEQIGMTNPKSLETIRPMQYLSYTSKLIELASSGKHYETKVDPVSLRKLIAWVDACCPYRGDEEIRALDDPDFPGIELLPIRPRVKTAPRIERP